MKKIQDNHRVQMFDSKGQFAGKFGTMGPGLGQFHHPQFIAIHKRTQNIYVTDSSNHRVCVFDHNGNPIFHFGTEGYQNGQMKFPRGIAVDDQVSAQNLTLQFLHAVQNYKLITQLRLFPTASKHQSLMLSLSTASYQFRATFF